MLVTGYRNHTNNHSSKIKPNQRLLSSAVSQTGVIPEVSFAGQQPQTTKSWISKVFDKFRQWWKTFLNFFKKTPTKTELELELQKHDEQQKKHLNSVILAKFKCSQAILPSLFDETASTEDMKQSAKELSESAKALFEIIEKKNDLIKQLETKHGSDLVEKKKTQEALIQNYSKFNKSPEELKAIMLKEAEMMKQADKQAVIKGELALEDLRAKVEKGELSEEEAEIKTQEIMATTLQDYVQNLNKMSVASDKVEGKHANSSS